MRIDRVGLRGRDHQRVTVDRQLHDFFPSTPATSVIAGVAGLALVDERLRSYEARLRTMVTPTSPNIAGIEACGM